MKTGTFHSIFRLVATFAAAGIIPIVPASARSGNAAVEQTARVDRNIDLARMFYEAFDSRDPGRMDALFADDAIDHDGPDGETVPALKNTKGLVGSIAQGLADYHHTIEHTVAQGDMVFVRWELVGKHTGNLYGVSPTNKRITLHGHDLMRVKDSKIVEIWHVEELLQLMQKISG